MGRWIQPRSDTLRQEQAEQACFTEMCVNIINRKGTGHTGALN